MRFTSNDEIRELVDAFESASIARDDWKHAEHLTVALYYLDLYDLETATSKMRDGIFKLLREGFMLDFAKEMPYHETLTTFWMRAVADFNGTRRERTLVDRANELVETYDKNFPLRFYSRELLFSDAARAAFVEPDLAVPDLGGSAF